MPPKFNVNDVTAMMEKRFAEFKTGLLQDLSKDIQTFVDERKDELNNEINVFFLRKSPKNSDKSVNLQHQSQQFRNTWKRWRLTKIPFVKKILISPNELKIWSSMEDAVMFEFTVFPCKITKVVWISVTKFKKLNRMQTWIYQTMP